MAALQIAELSQATLEGTGTFDVLMRSVKEHLDTEFKGGRIKGPEYAEVYLGSMNLAMQTGLGFLLQKRKNDIEAQLLTAQLALVTQQGLNAVIEGEVLTAQKCKLQAEFDLTQAQTRKSEQEILLLAQKVATERAQITALGVDEDSVIGKQKALYGAQTDGFKRDAEQKAAKMMIDSWSVRRTTDEATVADGTNMLNDVTVGRAVNKVLSGVGA